MTQARVAKRGVGVGVDGAAIPGDERRGYSAAATRRSVYDGGSEIGADGGECQALAIEPIRRRCEVRGPAAAEGKARGGEAFEIGAAREVVSAGRYGSGWRAEDAATGCGAAR